MVGEKIREIRKGGGHSLAEIAADAGISAATLSRIETGRQPLDMELLLRLASVLRVEPRELMGADGNGGSNGNGDGDGSSASLAREIHALQSPRRAALWRSLAAEPRRRRGMSEAELAAFVDELLAQVDLVRMQLEAVRARLKSDSTTVR
jgi:transcriptional regulator with XRE-family HTH domain